MSISQRPFGVTPNGEKVTEYTMTNRDGASVSMLDFGGIITRILVPDRDGKLDDVSLSFDDIDVYAQGRSGSMGMLIGRVGNRIRGASFELEGRTYTLPKNNNGNCLHGGMGFGLRMWQARPVLAEGGDALELTLTSQDGDQGFPGTLKVKVTYTFTDHNELGIHYQASTDKTTLCSLTNHAYFNLDGHASGSVRDLEMQINADLVTEVGEGLIPTGRLLPVSEVPYNFTSPTRIGDVLDKTPDCPGMTMAKGVDFNFCAGRDRETKVIATLYSPKTGPRHGRDHRSAGRAVLYGQPSGQRWQGRCALRPICRRVPGNAALSGCHSSSAFPQRRAQAAGYLRYPDHLSLWRAVKGGAHGPDQSNASFPRPAAGRTWRAR